MREWYHIMPSRREVTEKLIRAGVMHFVRLRYGCFTELGVIPCGKRRADIITINMQGKITCIEVKSCKADFTSDRKYHEYLPHCHKMYILVPPDSDWIKDYSQVLKEQGIGVLYLCPKSGFIKTMFSAKIRPMKSKDKRNIIFRMCFRSATYSKKNTKRYKVFI